MRYSANAMLAQVMTEAMSRILPFPSPVGACSPVQEEPSSAQRLANALASDPMILRVAEVLDRAIALVSSPAAADLSVYNKSIHGFEELARAVQRLQANTGG